MHRPQSYKAVQVRKHARCDLLRNASGSCCDRGMCVRVLTALWRADFAHPQESAPLRRGGLWAGKEEGGGINQWDRATLADPGATERFQRLMGARPGHGQPGPTRPSPHAVQPGAYYERIEHESAVAMAQAGRHRYHRGLR